jgi:glycosyltransferase involved in cell wall biosynthesis
MKLSIVMPVYNEADTIAEIVRKVMSLDVEKELVIVDDASTDATIRELETICRTYRPVTVLRLRRNRGKGYALRQGFRYVTGDVVVVQDADLEYEPEDLKTMLAAIEAGKANVVYGSRVRGHNPMSHIRYYVGGRLLSVLTNMLYGASITDEPTCYKMFRKEVLDKIDLQCEGFEFCPEFTAKALKAGYDIAEVPIQYHPRKMAEGKKIRWYDGLVAIWTLIRLRFTK